MADLLLTNANGITMDQRFPKAQLIAVRDRRILAAEKDEDSTRLREHGAQIIDCNGKVVLPGFIDCHCHLLDFAENLATLDLRPANAIRSISDI